METKQTIVKFVLSKVEKIDYWFIAAALVEAPRLFAAFSVILEKAIFGVPLAILIAYGTSESWKSYFSNRNRKLLLVLNLISLVSTVVIIAPVLLYVINFHNLEIDLTKVISEEFWYLRLVYAVVLSASTFLPLILLACVKSYDSIVNNHNTFTTMEDVIVKLEEQFTTIKDSIVKLQEQFTTIEDTVVNNDNTFTTMKDSIVKLEEQVTTMKDSIVNNDNTFTTVYYDGRKNSKLNNDVVTMYEKFLKYLTTNSDGLTKGKVRNYFRSLDDNAFTKIVNDLLQDGKIVEEESNNSIRYRIA